MEPTHHLHSSLVPQPLYVDRGGALVGGWDAFCFCILDSLKA